MLTLYFFDLPFAPVGEGDLKIDIDDWFVGYILPLEGALTAYLGRVWNDASEVADLRQEIYVRVYVSAERRLPDHPRHFLFSVARNLLIDKFRKKRVVSIDHMEDLAGLHVLSEEIAADRILSGRQELARLEAAVDKLPPRCRETFVLRKIEEYSQRKAAEKMGVSEATIEKQMNKAMRLLAEYFWNVPEVSQKGTDTDSVGGHDEARG